MKVISIFIAIALWFSTMGNAQSTQNRANELMQQAQTSLEQKEYTKARYMYKLAYDAFATRENYAQAIQCGLKTVELYARENYYKEAFDLCREMNQLIYAGEQKQHKKFPELQFLLTQQRMRMFIALKNPVKAKEQLNQLQETAAIAKNDSLNEALLYTQATYYYTFGMNTQGDAAFNRLITQYKEKKEYEKVSQCYEKLIGIARKANNAGLVARTYEGYVLWTDSVKALTAQDKLNVLQQKYDESQQTLQEKDDTLSAKQYIIIGLCTLVAILIAALVLLAIILLRYIVTNKKLKKNIQLAKEHNALKTEFIRNISTQMSPALDTLTASAQALATEAPRHSQQMQLEVEGLKKFCEDIQELSSLENSLTELYEMREINANTFCEEMMDKIRHHVGPEVSTTVNAPKLQIKTNPEQLERILSYLLENAARHTESGKIILDFKKRGAHTHQFIVTDTGSGIPAEKQENLFKPFTEIKDLTQGDGLGLPICSLIATKMNGSLTLDATYTKGTRFVLELHV